MMSTTKKLVGFAITAVTVLGAALSIVPTALAQIQDDLALPSTAWMASYEKEIYKAAADALDMSLDELYAALAAGQTVWDLAEAQDVDVEDVWEAMEEASEDALAELVDEGVITQEQADWAAAWLQGTNQGQSVGPNLNQDMAQAFTRDGSPGVGQNMNQQGAAPPANQGGTPGGANQGAAPGANQGWGQGPNQGMNHGMSNVPAGNAMSNVNMGPPR